MIGVMSLWVGLMEIAQKSGLIAKMTKGISPFISFLFPKIPHGHPAREYISTNLIANILYHSLIFLSTFYEAIGQIYISLNLSGLKNLI